MTKTNQQKVKDFLINNGVIIVMFILVIYTGFTSDNFFTKNNFMNILMNMSSRLVIALGIAGCVITAGCDLSAGRMIGFGGCIAGTLLVSPVCCYSVWIIPENSSRICSRSTYSS